MKKLTRDEMKKIKGGYVPEDDLNCATKYCSDVVGEVRCGGNATCKCAIAALRCEKV